MFLERIPLERSRILLVAPPPLVRGTWVPAQKLIDASGELRQRYRALSDRLGVAFADAGTWNIPLAYDGVHFTEEGHRRFAEALAKHMNKGE